MKIIISTFTALMAALILSGCSGSKGNDPLFAMSFNIRYDNPLDGINAWQYRKEMVTDAVVLSNADLVGMQEVLKHQLTYLAENLPGFEVYGVGRNDGISGGEFCPVFFRNERFELLEKSTFWLSETPDSAGSIGWNAVLPRIVTWVKLNDRETGRDLFFFNTHFSHVSTEAREKSASLLTSKIREIAGNLPVILTGDFNCTGDSGPYKIIIAQSNENQTLYDTHFISKTEHSGGLNSINAFGRSGKEAIIDYIFCNSSFSVLSHAILAIKKDSVFVSDHYPVIAELEFND